MKKWCLPVLFLLLAGCGSRDFGMEEAMALREKLLSSTQCSFSANIIADYGTYLHSFTLENIVDALGNVHFQVQEPESILGISGRIGNTGGEILFDDTVLCFPLLADEQLSPVSAPWILMRALRSGRIASTCREDKQLRVTLYDSYQEDALMVDVWLEESGVPCSAQIYHNGRSILTIRIGSFVIS